ncbi:UDP-glucose pyrophosphorylase [Arboricoccus pini]|uniref:UTP--glucose-1-phosphate uridylyltransferase n=1 Tax=Arboricoccus pini TaxID=1963835 RepID=A0A212Q5X1_9PROT|nr:UTP--glucose-1-phosphate uridylyltransferase GalU [Arboricoccus pini]SNB54775.1 UDP-glucose pyrophosphorylase [Arboricoccus pini]
MAKLKTAVFPVAGLGTRMLPATKVLAKEMLPVIDKPIIQYAVEEAAAAGIEKFVFVTGRGKVMIEDHFDRAVELFETLAKRGKKAELERLQRELYTPGEIVSVRQQEPRGLGHAVWCARHLIEEEAFAVMLPDDLITGEKACLAQMAEAHAETGGNVIAVMEVASEHTERYGVITPGATTGRLTEVKGLVEKPKPEVAPSRLAVIGRYVLTADVFAHLSAHEVGAGGEIQLTDAMAKLIGVRPFHGLAFEGHRYDCGDKLGYLEAIVGIALGRSDLKDGFAQILKRYA